MITPRIRTEFIVVFGIGKNTGKNTSHVENYKNAYDKTEAENKKGPKGVAYILGEDK